MENYVHYWPYNGNTITFSWLGDLDLHPNRVYAFAFTDDDQLLLVAGTDDNGYWLPGGGVKRGESGEEALKRELMEEAAATVHDLKPLGVQRAWYPHKNKASFHQIYWCRVSLAEEFKPEYEITERRVVSSDQFLDTLYWGRKDPKAEMLMAKAMAFNQQAVGANVPV